MAISATTFDYLFYDWRRGERMVGLKIERKIKEDESDLKFPIK